jgi:hypothetical protein
VFSSRSRIELAVVALGAGLTCAGCSFTFVTPPPSRSAGSEPRPNVECTTSNVAPIVDSVVTSYETFRVAYAAFGPDSAYRDSPIPRDADLALGVAFGGAFLASAIYGYVNTARCRRLRDGAPQQPYLPGVSRGETEHEPAAAAASLARP